MQTFCSYIESMSTDGQNIDLLIYLWCDIGILLIYLC